MWESGEQVEVSVVEMLEEGAVTTGLITKVSGKGSKRRCENWEGTSGDGARGNTDAFNMLRLLQTPKKGQERIWKKAVHHV